MKMASKTDKWNGERPLARIENCLSLKFCAQVGLRKRRNPMAESKDN